MALCPTCGQPRSELLNQPMLLADRANLIFQTIAGRKVHAVYDNGHAIARQVTMPLGSSALRAGQYQVDERTGRVTLGSLPSGAVTCDLGDWLPPSREIRAA